jgi:hypothetical protein
MTHWSKVLLHTEAMMLVTFEDTYLSGPDVYVRSAVYPTSVPVTSTEPEPPKFLKNKNSQVKSKRIP